MNQRKSTFLQRFLATVLVLGLGCGGSQGGTGTNDDSNDPATGDGSAAGDGSSGGAGDGSSGGNDDGSSAADGSATGDGSSAGAGDGTSAGDGDAGTDVDVGDLEPFSFFVTSLKAMQELSGSQEGFGGDLSFGETGEGRGLRGADKICAAVAERSMPGASAKGWRAFLSATAGGANGGPVHAIDRIGTGPWYDRVGRLVANDLEELAQTRPATADTEIKNDLPNEDGVPNHNPDGAGEVDNHDTLTGTGSDGQLYDDDPDVTCDDWTSSEGRGSPRVGHSWPRGGGRPGGGGGGGGGSGEDWMSALDEAGCAPGVSLIEMGPPDPSNPTVGSGGGYGGIYCFALTP